SRALRRIGVAGGRGHGPWRPVVASAEEGSGDAGAVGGEFFAAENAFFMKRVEIAPGGLQGVEFRLRPSDGAEVGRLRLGDERSELIKCLAGEGGFVETGDEPWDHFVRTGQA